MSHKATPSKCSSTLHAPPGSGGSKSSHRGGGHGGHGGGTNTGDHLSSPETAPLVWGNKNVVYMCLLIDGVGLAIIAACTILEGMELWKDFFNEYWSSNSSALGFWFTGRFIQVVGLVLLIAFAAIFQNHAFADIERLGMVCLTAGPILNIVSNSLFDNNYNMTDPYFLFNKQWLSNEFLELFGIVILDLSLIDMEEHLVLAAEVVGFSILAIAATADFTYTSDERLPLVTMRLDAIHLSDTFGLFLLTAVAVLQYKMKMEKHSIELSRDAHSSSGSSGSSKV